MYSEAYLLAKEARSYLEALRGTHAHEPREIASLTAFARVPRRDRLCACAQDARSVPAAAHIMPRARMPDATDDTMQQEFKSRADECFAKALKLKRGIRAIPHYSIHRHA